MHVHAYGHQVVCCSDIFLPSRLPASLPACRVENEDREPDQTLLAALEAAARVALLPPTAASGPASPISVNWGGCVDAALVANLGRYRRYDYTSLRDLLRVVGAAKKTGGTVVQDEGSRNVE